MYNTDFQVNRMYNIYYTYMFDRPKCISRDLRNIRWIEILYLKYVAEEKHRPTLIKFYLLARCMIDWKKTRKIKMWKLKNMRKSKMNFGKMLIHDMANKNVHIASDKK